MKAGEPEIALDVTLTRFTAHVELHAFQRAPSRLRRDVDHPVAGARTIQRRARRALDHLDIFDVVGIDVGQIAVDDDAVNDVQRILAASRGVDRRRPTQQDCGLRARPPARRDDVRTRHLPLELRQGIGRRNGELRCVHARHGKWHLHLLGRLLHAGHDDRLEQVDVVRKRKVHRLLARRQRDRLTVRLEADPPRAHDDLLAADAGARHDERVLPRGVRRGAQPQLFDDDVRTGDGLAAI